MEKLVLLVMSLICILAFAGCIKNDTATINTIASEQTTETVVCSDDEIIAKDYTKENVPVSYQKTDVNLDGETTISDATIIQKYLSGKDSIAELQLSLAGIDNPSDVSIDDATHILKLSVELI